ncbi:MAG: hypothetical protein KAR05_11905 [Candidatus Omnitrophica bacterium]|nr:hypothetical protein [Candidatus Omnitrophota bacterium]
MPIIRVTQKLQKEIGVKFADLPQIDETDMPFAEWYAHVFMINRKKQLIFVERQTLFSFVCADVTRKDLRGRIPEIFEKGLGKALFVEGAGGELVKSVMDACRGEIRFTKTQDRHTIGSMNEFVKSHKDSFAYHRRPSELRDRLNHYMPVRGFPGIKKHDFAIDVFARVVKDRFGLDFVPYKEDFMSKIFADSDYE